jgi:glycerophosphoryl diester phosphodiesterase
MRGKSIVKKGVVSVGFLALLVMAVMAAMALPVLALDGDKIVIAHRGASGYLPEHTLEAYVMAYALGADYIEPDLVLTNDGVFVCLHDIHLERTTNVEEVFPDRHRGDGRWYAADFTLEEIKQLGVHERCNEEGTPVFPGRFPVGGSQFKVPTFAEMIERIPGLNKATGRDVGIYPEIKKPSWHETEGLPMEEALLNIFNQYGYEGQDAKVYVQCFEADPLKKMRFYLGTDLPLVQLIGGGTEYDQMVTEEGLDEIATYANGIGPSKVRIEDNPDLVNWAQMDSSLTSQIWLPNFFRSYPLRMVMFLLDERCFLQTPLLLGQHQDNLLVRDQLMESYRRLSRNNQFKDFQRS